MHLQMLKSSEMVSEKLFTPSQNFSCNNKNFSNVSFGGTSQIVEISIYLRRLNFFCAIVDSLIKKT